MARTSGTGLNRLKEDFQVSNATRKSMQQNRSVDSKVEILLRKSLWHCGMRGYRKNVRRLPGKPDIVFAKHRVAVFVHGCFWHGCDKCRGGTRIPKTNSRYWEAKITGNQERDLRNKLSLEAMGYSVLIFWECEINKDIAPVLSKIKSALSSDKGGPSQGKGE